MKKFSFTAKIANYGFKNHSENDNEKKSWFSKKREKNNEYFQENVINIDTLSLEALTSQLSVSLDKRQPIFLWSKNRAIEKVRLDNERQLMLKERLEGLRLMGDSMMSSKADALISQEMVDLLAKKNLKNSKVELERIIEKSKSELSYYKRTVQENKLSYESMEIDNKLKSDHGIADVAGKNAKVKMADLMHNKIEAMDLLQIPVDILHEVFGFVGQDSKDGIDAIARYQKSLSDVDVNKAETYRRYADAKKKMAEGDSDEIRNYMEMKNYEDSIKQK